MQEQLLALPITVKLSNMVSPNTGDASEVPSSTQRLYNRVAVEPLALLVVSLQVSVPRNLMMGLWEWMGEQQEVSTGSQRTRVLLKKGPVCKQSTRAYGELVPPWPGSEQIASSFEGKHHHLVQFIQLGALATKQPSPHLAQRHRSR